MKMNLNTKILVAAAASVLVSTVAGVVTVYHLSTKNRIDSLHYKMSDVLKQSEAVAEGMDFMHKNDAFDDERLIKKALEQSGGRPLRETYRETVFYRTIPIVAAWQSMEDSARENGFEFSTPSTPGLVARNPKNNNGEHFLEAFAAFERGETEYFLHDKKAGRLIVARPVRLASSCLDCHGDPRNSLTEDGMDVLGFPMENMKVGDLKGAFVLETKISGDPVVKATAGGMLLVGGIVLVVVLIGFYLFSKWMILRPLTSSLCNIDQMSDQSASAAEQVANASETLAEGASAQAASLEEASASLEEITSMGINNSGAANRAKDLAHATRTAADSGSMDMEQMKAAMRDIKSSSDEVANIVKNIDEIAFQTNILALNAAVEAARAGEAGAGFAVVADEVRNLARRSAAAAKETAAKITSAIENSERGVRISGRVAEGLEEIVCKVHEVDRYMEEIADASNEQAIGVGQVSVAVNEMDKVTQNNAASAEECACAAGELNAQTESVKESVHALLRMIGGAGGGSKMAVSKNRTNPTHSNLTSPNNYAEDYPRRTAADPKNQQEGFAMPDEADFKSF